MQLDFHYYATFCAAVLAGYSRDEGLRIAYSTQFVDCCTRTLLKKVNAPLSAATTQLQGELISARTDIVGLQDITRIWASFHFLPYDLHAKHRAKSPTYKSKYRLICKPNGCLLKDTVELAKGHSLESVGIAMHILADTWAHAYFAGTPSQVINNTMFEFYEVRNVDGEDKDVPIRFRHSASVPDDPEQSIYTNSINSGTENFIMNLGHGRAGHLPDYSYVRYRYLPAWADYESVLKDNPAEYRKAFCQMIYAMKYLRGVTDTFDLDHYDYDAIAPYEERLHDILTKRQLDASADWKAFGEELCGGEVPDFDILRMQTEYLSASKEAKDVTRLGQFCLAAMRQKSMVTGKIFQSGNMLAGISVDYYKSGFRGIRDFSKLVDLWKEEHS